MPKSESGAHLIMSTTDLAWSDDTAFGLYFLRWVVQETSFRVTTMTRKGGPMAAAYGELGPVVDLNQLNEWRLPRALALVGLRRLGGMLKNHRLRAWLRHADPKLIVANDAVAARLALFVDDPSVRVIARLDGLAAVGPTALPPGDRADVVARTDVLVVSSTAARARAAKLLELPEERIVISSFPVAPPRPGDAAATRAAFGIDPAAVLVAVLGSPHPWDDPDRFVAIAWNLVHRWPEVPWTFVWFTDQEQRSLWPLHHDLANAGLENRVVVTSTLLPLHVLQAADALALPGRTVAVPMLWHEAIAASCPVVTFDHGELGGFARAGAGTAVPFPDLDAFADAIAEVVLDPDKREAAVRRAETTAARGADQIGELRSLIIALAGPTEAGPA